MDDPSLVLADHIPVRRWCGRRCAWCHRRYPCRPVREARRVVCRDVRALLRGWWAA